MPNFYDSRKKDVKGELKYDFISQQSGNQARKIASMISANAEKV